MAYLGSPLFDGNVFLLSAALSRPIANHIRITPTFDIMAQILANRETTFDSVRVTMVQ